MLPGPQSAGPPTSPMQLGFESAPLGARSNRTIVSSTSETAYSGEGAVRCAVEGDDRIVRAGDDVDVPAVRADCDREGATQSLGRIPGSTAGDTANVLDATRVGEGAVGCAVEGDDRLVPVGDGVD